MTDPTATPQSARRTGPVWNAAFLAFPIAGPAGTAPDGTPIE